MLSQELRTSSLRRSTLLWCSARPAKQTGAGTTSAASRANNVEPVEPRKKRITDTMPLSRGSKSLGVVFFPVFFWFPVTHN